MAAEDAKNRARILRALREEVEGVVGRLQLRIYRNLTFANPVLTGFSRGAWTPSVSRASTATDHPPRDREEAKSQGEFSFARNQRISDDIVRTYQLANGPVFISNNTPYIGRLNDGHSADAPARFVEAAIAQAIRSSG